MTRILSAGLAGSLLLALALLLDRAAAPGVAWEGPLQFDADRGEYLPRCTVPLETGPAACLELRGAGDAAVRMTLHVRDDDGACLGEREVRAPARLCIPLRPAAAGPHTFVWRAAQGPAAPLALRIHRRQPLPVLPVCAAAAVFVLAGAAGLAVSRRGRPPAAGAARLSRISDGALLGILLALLVLAASRAADDPLVLRAEGPVESP
jgi:hypothetical protein